MSPMATGSTDAADGKTDHGAAEEGDGLGGGHGALAGLDAQQGHVVELGVQGRGVGEAGALVMVAGIRAEGAREDGARVRGGGQQRGNQQKESAERPRGGHTVNSNIFAIWERRFGETAYRSKSVQDENSLILTRAAVGLLSAGLLLMRSSTRKMSLRSMRFHMPPLPPSRWNMARNMPTARARFMETK